MPLDPQTLSDLLRQSDQPQTIDNVQSPQPTQPPAPIPPSQQTDTPAPQPDSTKLLLKPSQSSTPASLQDMMLQGAYAASNGPGMTIPTYKDDTSPARSILSNMFLGMGASLTGQKFQSIQERKYQRYLDNVKLNLEQQQRNQQLQIGMTNAVAKMTKDQNNIAFRNRVEDIKQETDATKLAFKKAQFETQTGLNWAKFAQQDQRFQDLSRHMNDQDSQAAINHNPQIKDSDYLRAVALTQAKYGSQGLDPSDSQVYPKFLQDVEDTTMAIKAQQAKMRAESSQKPPQALITDPATGTFIVARPGTPIPAGTQTPTQVGQVNTPTTATRRAGEQGNIIQNVGEELISKLQENRDVIGDTSTYWKKAKNDTPFADPRLSGVNALLKSYIALQPALHGFRSAEAMKEFEKAIGGTPKNVDALIAAIRATNETGGIVSLAGQGKLGSPKIPSISSQADYDNLPNGAQYNWNGQTLTKGKK